MAFHAWKPARVVLPAAQRFVSLIQTYVEGKYDSGKQTSTDDKWDLLPTFLDVRKVARFTKSSQQTRI